MRSLKLFISLNIYLFCFSAFCQVKLPRLISDGMVLQRNQDVNVWGWASPQEEVTLTFGDKKFQTKADDKGDWKIALPPQKAGGPYSMTFSASNEVTLTNILFGDVWLCSGQSNMELSMERVKEKYAQVIKNADNNKIRQFLVPDAYDFKAEHKDLENGSWISASPESVLNFSAVAYFFAKELYENYKVPVGLINSALGGSPVEAWMSEEALKQFPSSYQELQNFKNDSLITAIEEADRSRSGRWYSELNKNDQGLKNEWHLSSADDSNWKEMNIPGYWANEAIGDVNGVVWFRKQVDVPSSMVGKKASLWLGRIVDQDFAYVNGEMVGTTSYQYPPRRYTVNPGILKEGENTIAVRVVNSTGQGGFILDKPYFLAVGSDTIHLTGEWKYKPGTTMEPLASQTFIRWKPGGLFNKMIAPLTNYKIKGVIWYQGESNVSDPEKYKKAFPAMIRNWRNRWDQGDFPFLYVQLANFLEPTDHPKESSWAELRQAQLETLSESNTGMAVAIDLGEWNDIHPLNKEDVGKRLSLLARKLAYKESVHANSPAPESAEFKQDHVMISLKNIGPGLTAKNGELNEFTISADGKSFVRAKASIEGDKVKVWSNKIKNPVAVRYAWADNPAKANLYTKNGLPASPFEVRK